MGKHIRVGGEPLTFRFDVAAWLQIEERFGSLTEMDNQMKYGSPMKVGLQMAAIVASRGAVHRQGGRAKPVTVDMLAESLSPMEAKQVIACAQAAIMLGLKRENVDDEDEDVDEVVAELAKKAEATSKPGSASPSA